MEFFRLPGRYFIAFLHYMGQLASLLAELRHPIGRGALRLRLVAHQIVAIGYGSQIVVIVTGAFTGAVFTFQMYGKLKEYGGESSVGIIVSIALCRELGPVLSGLMVAGRVGASMAADIGTMKVTEQIDALRVMGVHPVDYLVLPRIIAMLVSMPLLVAESIVFGLLASYIVAVHGFGVPHAWYWPRTLEHTNMQDLSCGMIKGVVFGLIITVISCHQGLKAENGAVGVGLGTTRAVVTSSLVLLVLNLFLTILLNNFFPLSSSY